MNKHSFSIGIFLGAAVMMVGWMNYIYKNKNIPPKITQYQTTENPATFEIIKMNVSAYDVGECCCGEFADGITASGVPAVGLICAAPPEYPFGTKFELPDGTVYINQDRGSAVTGNKLDLLMSSHDLARQFGREIMEVKVYYMQETK